MKLDANKREKKRAGYNRPSYEFEPAKNHTGISVEAAFSRSRQL